MKRRSSSHSPGLIFHIYNRGNNRGVIFHDEADHLFYLLVISEARVKFGFKLFAYCLIPNHYHLVIQVGDTPIYKIMHWIQLRFAIRYNKKYAHTGHVFEERFHSELVAKNSYFLELLRYVHLNPYRAGLAKGLLDYRWTSAHSYFAPPGEIEIDSDFPLSVFSDDENEARTRLREFFEAGITESTTDPGPAPDPLHPQKDAWEDSLNANYKDFGIAAAILRGESRTRRVAAARRDLMRRAYQAGISPHTIARHLNRSISLIYKELRDPELSA
ncbi:MAG: hypothetical protein COR54_04045 [Elusimicrobia bacterium CG22_combo_CG10-13_8_21_14_all_63_91]|nr:MAG: hypothetical protein COR54_04045 [Elusimicrobia bacterium CG22_combo_CG10-13_8_21_14_all_63_91]